MQPISSDAITPRRRTRIPSRETIDDDTPLTLSVAAELAFPDGSMTASSLRSEATKGRLQIEKIAGRLFTTLAAIQEMRARCRVPPSPLASISADEKVDLRSTSSSTRDLKSAQAAALIASERLRKRSHAI